MKKNQITQKDAERLSNTLANAQFKTSKCEGSTRIKLVRTQIAIDPISDQVKKARETAEKQFLSDRLKELIKLSQDKKIVIGTPEAAELQSLFDAYQKNMDDAIGEILEKEVPVPFEKLTIKEYEAVLESNADWISGDVPKLIFTQLVDESAVDKEAKE